MQYMRKGAAQVCGCVEVVNQDFSSTVERPRLVPRTLDLPIYSTLEFNEKVGRPGFFLLSVCRAQD